jgi:hypothetical protein
VALLPRIRVSSFIWCPVQLKKLFLIFIEINEGKNGMLLMAPCADIYFLPSNSFQDNMKIEYLYLPCNLSGLFQFWIRISNSIHILFRAIGTLA